MISDVQRAHLTSLGFRHLIDDLYYKIEAASMVVTGIAPPSKKLINTLITEGRFQGGFNDKGEVFGDFIEDVTRTVRPVWWTNVTYPVLEEHTEDKEEDARALDALRKRHFEELKQKHSDLMHSHRVVLAQLDDAKLQVEDMKARSAAEIAKIKADYERRSHTRRLQFEVLPFQRASVEGLSATVWEVEDSQGEARYVVMTTSARGTTSEVERTWINDLKAKMVDHMGHDRFLFVTVPDNAAVSINEILPSEQEEDDDVCQF